MKHIIFHSELTPYFCYLFDEYQIILFQLFIYLYRFINTQIGLQTKEQYGINQ